MPGLKELLISLMRGPNKFRGILDLLVVPLGIRNHKNLKPQTARVSVRHMSMYGTYIDPLLLLMLQFNCIKHAITSKLLSILGQRKVSDVHACIVCKGVNDFCLECRGKFWRTLRLR